MGFGHIRRSLTLARLLEMRTSLRIRLVSGAAQMNRIVRELFGGLEVMTEMCGQEPARVAIFDLEAETMRAQLSLAAPATKRLCLDWFDPSILPDVTMNLIDHDGLMREAYRAINRETDYTEGPACAIIRPNLYRLRPIKTDVALKVRHVLVTMGGADPSRRTVEALLDLAGCSERFERITVIVGPLVPEGYETEIRALAPRNSEVLRAPVDYDGLMAAADVVLCSGGGTLLESMSLAKPTVVYPQTVAEEKHALLHARTGACAMRFSLTEVLSSFDLRKSIGASAHRRVDGRGAERVTQAALRLLKQN